MASGALPNAPEKNRQTNIVWRLEAVATGIWNMMNPNIPIISGLRRP